MKGRGDSMKRDIDARGMRCPRPIIEVAKAKRGLESGGEIVVVADDPAFETDIRAWCDTTGCEIKAIEREGQTVKVTIVIK